MILIQYFPALQKMAIVFKLWLSIIELFILTLLGAFIVVYGIIELSVPEAETAGVFTLIVDFFLPFS
jgi:hypothetical protein